MIQEPQPEYPSVTFQVKSHRWPLTLTYDFNSLADAEPIVGVNLLGALTSDGTSFSALRGIIFALLRPTNPEITLLEVGNLLQNNRKIVGRAYLELLAKQQAIEEEHEDHDPTPVPVLRPDAEPIPAVN